VYYTSQLDVLCGLCNQVTRAGFVAELERMAARRLQERAMFENTLEGCQKEIELLRQHSMKTEPGHQVSKAGFNFNQIRIIYFCPASLKERKML
jgi:hypothetical protein